MSEPESNNKWYKFRATINKNNLDHSKIYFPAPPLDYQPVGKQVHEYLVSNGFCIYPGVSQQVSQDCVYQPRDNCTQQDLEKVIALCRKFEPKGAAIEVVGESKTVSTPAPAPTREEFLDLCRELKQLKKQSAIAEVELQELESQLNDLIN